MLTTTTARYTAITEGNRVKIDTVLTDAEHKSFLDSMATEGYATIDAALDNIRAENTTASKEADLRAIRLLVESRPGGSCPFSVHRLRAILLYSQ